MYRGVVAVPGVIHEVMKFTEQAKSGRSGSRGKVLSDERGRYIKAKFPKGKVRMLFTAESNAVKRPVFTPALERPFCSHSHSAQSRCRCLRILVETLRETTGGARTISASIAYY